MPIVTVIGIGVALLIGGAVVTESVFAIPGLGRLTVDAILRRDYPGDPGHRVDVQLRLYAGQSDGRRHLHPDRPEDPLLTASTTSSACRCRRALSIAQQLPDLLLPVKVRRGAARLPAQQPDRRHRRRFAALVLVLIGIFAPYLGTVDPTALAPAKRRVRRRRTTGSAPTRSAAISIRACCTGRGSRSRSAFRWR